MSDAPEFSRVIKLDRLPPGPMAVRADAGERAALAHRFALPSIATLEADVTLTPDGPAIAVKGELRASIEQHCAVSGEPFANRIAEAVAIRFVPAGTARVAEDAEEGLELAAGELDEIEYDGAAFDLGEALAQTLALAIDPYATGPDAARVRHEAGLTDEDTPSGPFAALAGLRKDQG